MKKALQLAIGALLLIGLVAVGAFAFKGAPGEDVTYEQLQERAAEYGKELPFTEAEFNERIALRDEHRAEMDAHREAVEAAMESGDYAAWREAMADAPRADMLDKITEENFPKLVRLHELREEARTIAEELGLEQGMGPGKEGMRQGRGMHPGMQFGEGQGFGRGFSGQQQFRQ